MRFPDRNKVKAAINKVGHEFSFWEFYVARGGHHLTLESMKYHGYAEVIGGENSRPELARYRLTDRGRVWLAR